MILSKWQVIELYYYQLIVDIITEKQKRFIVNRLSDSDIEKMGFILLRKGFYVSKNCYTITK